MAKRKPRVLDRREIGMYLSKGKAGCHVHLLYEVFYSDGTTKLERGHTIFAQPGLRDLNPWMMKSKAEKKFQKLTYRPDLSAIMDMMVIGWERLSSACYSADRHTEEPVKIKMVSKRKKRG